MSQHEQRFPSSDGLQLYHRCWLPESEAAAAVAVVHGFTEHSGRYADLAADLNRHGFAVYALDLRGHGLSEGEPVFIRSFEEYLADVELFLSRVRAQQPGKPAFLFGYSLGGTISTLLAIAGRAPVRGLALSGPGLLLDRRVFPLLRWIAPVLGWMFPRLRTVRVSAKRLSRDPQVIAQFESDPLVFHGRLPLRTGAEILRAVVRAHAAMEKLTLPFLVMHGTGDTITDPEGSRQLHARAASADKTLRLYEGLYHDLLHEPEREQVTADLIEWLWART